MAVEQRRKEIGVLRFAGPLCRRSELVTPAEVSEAIHVGLIVVEHGVAGRVIGNLESCARSIQIKVDDVVRARCILDLAKAEIIGALVMEVFNLVSCRVENHRLASHAAELSRTRKEQDRKSVV